MNSMKILIWLPRLLAILVIGFTSLFALDVFGVGYAFMDTLVALFMHLLPQIFIGVALLVAWRKPGIGGLLFLLLGAASLLLFGQPFISPAHLILTIPVLLIGILLLLQCRLSQGKMGLFD